jgi:molybdopterin-guanine dinucleotide biosynthesis protein
VCHARVCYQWAKTAILAKNPAVFRKIPVRRLALVEGFKHERGLAKIEVFDPARQRPALYLTDPDVLAVACDAPLPDCPLPRFSRNDVEGILQLIYKSVLS